MYILEVKCTYFKLKKFAFRIQLELNVLFSMLFSMLLRFIVLKIK